MRLDDVRRGSGLRHDFVAHLREWGAAHSDFDAANLAFGELVANVVQHAAGPVRIDLEWSKCLPILHVADRGPGFVPYFERPVSPLSETGRGLFLVTSLVGPLSVRRRPRGGARVSVTLPVHRKECTGACGSRTPVEWT